MNIFLLDTNPVKAAQLLDDKRVTKMCLETAQMLSTAARSTGVDKGYKSTHVNHPCNWWARASRANFLWLYEHGIALCKEYTARYGRRHKSQDVIESLKFASMRLEDKGLTPFANCAANKEFGIDYKHVADVVTAYRLYLNDRWDTDKRAPTWYGEGR